MTIEEHDYLHLSFHLKNDFVCLEYFKIVIIINYIIFKREIKFIIEFMDSFTFFKNNYITIFNN